MRKALVFPVYGFLALWLLVTYIAIAAMYKLWWERERIHYLCQPVSQQRHIVFEQSGLSTPLLITLEQIKKNWPEGTQYAISGDWVKLSYAMYLLIPRIPSGSETYTLFEDGTFKPEDGDSLELKTPSERSNPRGFVLSVTLLSGVGICIRRWLKDIGISFPEGFGCAMLIALILVVGSRSILQTAVPGFIILSVIGGIAWCAVLIGVLRDAGYRFQTSLWRGGFGYGHLQTFFSAGLWAIICLSVIWSFIMGVVVVPDDWDAWAIWGAKAKVLALGSGPLKDVTYFGHGDYPLLWPSIWAYSGWLSGGWEEMWSKGWGSVFFLLTIWEILVITRRVTRDGQLGILAGALFASIPMAALVASWGYAEAPFWLLTTSCAGCILLFLNRAGTSLQVLIVAALLAAAAAYTKNEGVLYALLATFWLVILSGEKRVSRGIFFLAIFIICYIPWYYWTSIVLGLGSHATAGLRFDQASLIWAADRVWPALQKISQMWLDIRQWNVVLGGVLLAALLCINRLCFIKRAALPIVLLLGYFVIMIFHRDDIYWQVGTSWNRLTLHVVPLLIIFCIQYLSSHFMNTGEKTWHT